MQLFALFILGLPSGRLFDSGHFRAQLAVGSVLWCFGMYMLSLSKTYYQIFLSWAVCQGVRFPSRLLSWFLGPPALRSTPPGIGVDECDGRGRSSEFAVGPAGDWSQRPRPY